MVGKCFSRGTWDFRDKILPLYMKSLGKYSTNMSEWELLHTHDI